MSLMDKLSLNQLCYLMSLPEHQIELAYIRMITQLQPTQSIQNLVVRLRNELCSQNMIVVNNLISHTNCVVKLVKPKIGITEFSIFHTRYDSYEIALKGKKGIIYKSDLGFDHSLPNFDTIEEVIQIIKKTYEKLCELQTEYNRKKRQRHKANRK